MFRWILGGISVTISAVAWTIAVITFRRVFDKIFEYEGDQKKDVGFL